MAFASDSTTAPPRRPDSLGRLLTDAAAAMWTSVVPWLPTRAGFWAMMVGRPFVLARVRPDGLRRFRSAAD